MVYNAEEMIGDNEQMVAIGMVEEDGDEGEQVGKTNKTWKFWPFKNLKRTSS